MIGMIIFCAMMTIPPVWQTSSLESALHFDIAIFIRDMCHANLQGASSPPNREANLFA